MAEIAEWVQKDAVLARLRYVALPEGARLVLSETGAGALQLRVEGLPPGLSLNLTAGQTVARMRLTDGAGQLTLSVPGASPGMVMLRLFSSETGEELNLVGPWPARNGMILSPGNSRLERGTALSVEALRGWRAVSPTSASGYIQFRLDDRLPVAVRVEGEIPLAAQIPLIRSMLAHAGPDAQVCLSLIVAGKEGHRLEIRRYHRQAVIQNGQLRLGLPRDERAGKETAFSQILGRGKAILNAVDLNAPERTQCREIDVDGAVDLRSLLPESDAIWLIQATLEGQTQRPVVWSPHPVPHSTREERITRYATEWTRLLENPEDSSWERQWKLIRAAGQGGDAGVLDQVQALAKVPAAAVALLFRVSKDELSQALALDMAAPIFWPALPVKGFRKALACEYSRLVARYFEVLGVQHEAENEAITALTRRISNVLALHPEIAGILARRS